MWEVMGEMKNTLKQHNNNNNNNNKKKKKRKKSLKVIVH